MLHLLDYVYTSPGFLTPEECARIINLSRGRLKPSLVVDRQTGGSKLDPGRISDGMHFAKRENDFIFDIEERIASSIGVSVDRLEDLQVLRYGPGGLYKPHYDYFEPSAPGAKEILKRGGQRVSTFIIYLSASLSGGATIFPNLNLSIYPEVGKALYFKYPGLDQSTYHGGAEVFSGEKWILTAWVREGRFV